MSIVREAGLNRNSFYYHFEDIYALLKWTLEQEAIEVVKQFDLMVEYEEAFMFVMDYIEKNEAFLKNICCSVGRDELNRFFGNDFIEIMRSIIISTEKAENLSVSDDFKAFLSQFYTEAIAGMLTNWILYPASRDKEKTMQYIFIIIHSAIPNALHSFAYA